MTKTLTTEEMNMILQDMMNGRKIRVTGPAAEQFVIDSAADVRKAAESGTTVRMIEP